MPNQPLIIYSFIPQIHTASSYYRIQLIGETCRDLGLPVQFRIDTNVEGISPQQRIQEFCEADVVVLYQPISDGTLNNVKMAKQIYPSKRGDTWKYPPSFVLDTDDNLFRVDPHNPAFANLGIRDPDTGQEIPKGCSISHMQDGVKRVLWQDGAKDAAGNVPFDVERNRATIETYVQLLNWADCVTTTTPRCAGPVLEYSNPRRVQVLPNLIRFDHFPQIDLVRDTSRVRVLWQGGQNHFLDWMFLKDAVRRLTEKYSELDWVMWGVQYNQVTDAIPPHRLTFLPWKDYREYKAWRATIGEDINLAPLMPTPFNQCRSAIKWYEAVASRTPAPTVAQATGPYYDEIEDGETGLLYRTPEEFEQKMSLLIENASERKRLAANAKDWVSENRDAFKHVPRVVQVYEELRRNAERDTPHMHEADWEKFEAEVKQQQEAAQKAA